MADIELQNRFAEANEKVEKTNKHWTDIEEAPDPGLELEISSDITEFEKDDATIQSENNKSEYDQPNENELGCIIWKCNDDDML